MRSIFMAFETKQAISSFLSPLLLIPLPTVAGSTFNLRYLCLCRNPGNYKVVVGEHNRNSNEGTEEEASVQRIISHPNYNSPRLSSDIALIQLSRPVRLSQRVNPVCLPTHDTDVPTGSKCYITG